jgi:hypothetical protein
LSCRCLGFEPEPIRPSARLSYTQPVAGSSRKKTRSAEPRAERGEPRSAVTTPGCVPVLFHALRSQPPFRNPHSEFRIRFGITPGPCWP